MSILKRIFPFIGWFQGYHLGALKADFVAGLTVALVLVPQSMAYAQLAGLPAYYGLYAAFLPPMVASLFGSSRQLATGPVAVVSLMTAATLEPLATAGSELFIAYALLLALIVGVFQFLLGVLRLGMVVNFLSHPVVNGFTNAAAIIIATSQLSKIFGVYVDKAPHHYETILRVLESALEYTHWPTLGMATLSFGIMIVLRRVDRRIPNVLVAVAVTILLSWATGFERTDTVRLDQVQSQRLRGLVGALNDGTRRQEVLAADRIESQTLLRDLLQKPQDGLCTGCHDGQESAPESRRSAGEKALAALHGGAGLLDLEILRVKREVSDLRAELRASHLVRGRAPGGEVLYYLREEIPEGIEAEGGTWRIRVGNHALDPEALSLSGGGAVVATIPGGLPALKLPVLDWGVIPRLLFGGVIISLLGFMEAISIAKAMAARTRQKIDPNQELIGQGLANIVGCLNQSYAVSGSFSRSAVNLQAGGLTGLSNVISSGVVMIVLLFLSGTLYHLPQAVLASVIMMAVVGLVNFSGFLHAWRTSRLDGSVAVVTFVGTLFFAPHLEWGIFIGVGLSLGAYLYRSMRPRVAELVPDAQGAMRDVSRHGLRRCSHVAVIGFEGPLNFASASYLESEILARVAELPLLRHVVIAGNGISELDASGEETLRHLVENLRGAGYEVSFSGVPDKIFDVLRRSHLLQRIGEDRFFPTRKEALTAVFPDAHRESPETECPYRQAMPPTVEVSLHPDGSLRDAARHGLRLCRHLALFRFDGPLTFANTAFLEEEILKRLSDRATLRQVVFVGHGISEMDEGGARKVGELVERLRKEGYGVSFTGLTDEVRDVLIRSGTEEVIEKGNIYPTQVMAIAGIYARSHAGSSEADCPLQTLAPHLTEMSYHHTGTLREAAEHHLKLCDHIGILRFSGPLVFSHPGAMRSEFIRWARRRPSVRYVVFLAQTLTRLDAGEGENLRSLVEEVRAAGYVVLLANVSDRVTEDMARSGVADAIGVDNIYTEGALAVASVFPEAHESGQEATCPLRRMLPHVTELSLHPDGSFRDAHRHGLALCQGIVAVRLDGPLNFATLRQFRDELRGILQRRPRARQILLAGHTLAGLDPIAAEELSDLFETLHEEGLEIAVSGVKDDVRALLHGMDAIYPTQIKAVEAIHERAHQGVDEKVCPLQEVVPARDS